MTVTDVTKLEALLGQLTELQDQLAHLQGGVAVLHVDAAVAALEDRIGRAKAAAGARSGRLTMRWPFSSHESFGWSAR